MKPTDRQMEVLQAIAGLDRGDGVALFPVHLSPSQRVLAACVRAGWVATGEQVAEGFAAALVAYRLTEAGWAALRNGKATGTAAAMLRSLERGPQPARRFEVEDLRLGEKLGWFEDAPNPPHDQFWRYIRITDRGRAAIQGGRGKARIPWDGPTSIPRAHAARATAG